MSLRDELYEQPEVLERLLATQTEAAAEVARVVRGRDVRWVLIAARGSSDHAALYAKYVWGARNGLPVALAAPSLFTVYASPPRLAGALVVGISQSGQSPDIVGVLAEARRQGAPTVAITNDPASPLAAEAETVLDTRAGPELAVAATKSYTSQLLAVAMISAALDGDASVRRELERVPERVRAALGLDAAAERAARRYRDISRCVVLARGFNLATAHEWSLKLKELAYVVAEPYSTADFRHGPSAILEGGFPVLAVVPHGPVFDEVLALLAELVDRRGVDLLTISDEPRALALGGRALPLSAGAPEWLTPVAAIVPAQLFTLHLTLAKGHDLEAPRGLSKVTRTW